MGQERPQRIVSHLARMADTRPTNVEPNPVKIGLLGAQTEVQVTNPLAHLVEHLFRLQRGKRGARLWTVKANRLPRSRTMTAGKRECVIAVHKYKIIGEALDCKRFFSVSSET